MGLEPSDSVVYYSKPTGFVKYLVFPFFSRFWSFFAFSGSFFYLWSRFNPLSFLFFLALLLNFYLGKINRGGNLFLFFFWSGYGYNHFIRTFHKFDTFG